MNDSFDVLMKLILPESIEEYFELTSYKKAGEELQDQVQKLWSTDKILIFAEN